jgi:hypothetical protein
MAGSGRAAEKPKAVTAAKPGAAPERAESAAAAAPGPLWSLLALGVRSSAAGATGSDDETRLQRKCAGCEEEESRLARAQAPGDGGEVAQAPSMVGDVLQSGGGRPLDPVTRAYFNMRFGHDFAGVRVTPASARQSRRAGSTRSPIRSAATSCFARAHSRRSRPPAGSCWRTS